MNVGNAHELPFLRALKKAGKELRLFFTLHVLIALGGLLPAYQGRNAVTKELHLQIPYRGGSIAGGLGDLISVPAMLGQQENHLHPANHDLPRYSLGRTEEDLKIINTFLLTLPHVPTIYYGDEIGMRHLDGLPSKEGAYDRTGARTPMQWDATANAGFSSAATERLYLPIDPDEDRPTVESQASNPDSVFNHLKALLRLRQENLALGASGSLTLLDIGSGAYPLLFLRESARDTFLIVLNPLERNFSLELPIDGSPGSVLIGNARFTALEGGSWRGEIPSLSASVVRWTRDRVDR